MVRYYLYFVFFIFLVFEILFNSLLAAFILSKPRKRKKFSRMDGGIELRGNENMRERVVR